MNSKNKKSNNQGVLFPIEEYIKPGKKPSENIHRDHTIYAIVKPEMLIWGRQYAYLSPNEASRKIGITIEKLREWENGISNPTINQLHNIAQVYKQLFAVFFLESPPKPARLPVKDFRRLPSGEVSNISYELANEIRTAISRREIAIQLIEDSEEEIQPFQLSATLEDNPSDISKIIRSALFSDLQKIPSFASEQFTFKFYREKVENLGILVFQASTVGIDEMRGFSIKETVYPVIVVNRRDSFRGRVFSIFHELTHILLRTSGICEIDPDNSFSSEEQKTEIFCNQVAAEILMPTQDFTDYAIHQLYSRNISIFTDNVISSLSNFYGASREAIVRKLLTIGLVDIDFYRRKREQYLKELANIPEKKKTTIRISPAKQIISLAGRTYCNLVINAISTHRITLNDASGYLNMRINQINKVNQFMGAYYINGH